MSYGDTAPDALAYDLAQSTFDAVERDGYRAEWSDDATLVVVTELDDGTEIPYNADDLTRAASDPEVRNAREPNGPRG
jgi:hypothetical protein